ncbi:MAG: RIP metalloprotease RseP [Candidatus Marinimicrobia bacterium]|jgi:regulator of sigma E protease|nr:RIP metalloprotease RseP [Candidatus Neomarinimicrobiota bacterium]MBT3575035.1 RIP metalloprotease RseP [Candidatus Neomarinimicrobiota bacterium]MBT3678807.1 RIP metalloprotease RseP [Candidatus Neomarinimicrobiota bacterium]MBT3949921.1 RIP metalloprotease RseP [Candidatus Neomarinimicrobiota bacterium]MBT4252624.1 RIP metalloprotease RseP [Candidatus Neomarinimicrobiota bacterium]
MGFFSVDTLITIAAAIFTLGILILIHELGHFLVARMVGIRVERFSIGMPPRFLSIQNKVDGLWVKLFIPWFIQRIANATTIEFRIPRKHPVAGDTEYALSWTPFGGYVKMSGMIDESMDGEITGKPWEFTSKKRWQQLLTISGGVIMNALLAFFIFTAIIFSTGMEEPVEGTFVGSLVSTEEREVFPAEEAGIMENDQIVMINGQSVTEWEELTGIVHDQPGKTISVEWLRNGIRYSDSIAVVKETVPTAEGTIDIGMIGIGRVTEHTDLGFVESVSFGARSTYMFGTLMARGFWSMVTGATSMDQVGGPIMIAKMAGDMARRGWLDVFYFMAIISVNLAFINILPIPGLDGGHFIIISIEGIIRRPLPLNVKLIIQQVGMLFLLGMVLFITIQDISRL